MLDRSNENYSCHLKTTDNSRTLNPAHFIWSRHYSSNAIPRKGYRDCNVLVFNMEHFVRWSPGAAFFSISEVKTLKHSTWGRQLMFMNTCILLRSSNKKSLKPEQAVWGSVLPGGSTQRHFTAQWRLPGRVKCSANSASLAGSSRWRLTIYHSSLLGGSERYGLVMLLHVNQLTTQMGFKA